MPSLSTRFERNEEARELLIDAIELWILTAVKDGKDLPVINGCKLAVSGPQAGGFHFSEMEAKSWQKRKGGQPDSSYPPDLLDRRERI